MGFVRVTRSHFNVGKFFKVTEQDRFRNKKIKRRGLFLLTSAKENLSVCLSGQLK
jgi:hypothetical protein